MTLEEIRALDAGEGEKIPLLEEVLDIICGKTYLFLELKARGVAARAVEEIKERDMIDDTLFLSFYVEDLQEVIKLSPNAQLGFAYEHFPTELFEARRVGAQVVLPQYRLATRRTVEIARQLNMLTVAWIVNDPQIAVRLRGIGVNGVVSDRPDIIMSAVGRRLKTTLPRPSDISLR